MPARGCVPASVCATLSALCARVWDGMQRCAVALLPKRFDSQAGKDAPSTSTADSREEQRVWAAAAMPCSCRAARLVVPTSRSAPAKHSNSRRASTNECFLFITCLTKLVMVGRRTHGQVLLDLVLCLSVNIDQTNMDLLLKVAPIPVSIRMIPSRPPAT